ncbi:Pyridine nucleotide-disulphide oxidoreductase [Legionella massiliensis]|uniref:Pyridine nucleotide-disulphide oxidoreductase n=1 Tax=Legionella massiliensis TaxID=1034943 RepID=A0A078KTB3_9GAMM|nr:FAD-dependent oxidoreductase [Legionella massiliensis]CDZ77715.1 Pyridine nucleotide-disulphide oxidoreductase [Legionella massiliensis]CEE13453.1 Pyridine nucleotide-disulfide oxidoreductase [Legionella massiliensis]
MNNRIYQWAVVGAGPAGIAAVGKLLDYEVPAQDILWIDPHFLAGDLGLLWRNVSSNTTVQRFLDFLNDVESFAYEKAPKDFHLNHLPPNDTCTLKEIVEPLEWVSQQLTQQVVTETATIHSMSLTERTWTLDSSSKSYKAKNVVLATGAVPSSLNYPGVDVVPFEIAIDKERLSNYVNKNDTYAVFGSSHSAIIIVRYLVDLGVKKIINFYRSPCRYAIEMGDWILFDNTGLKGQTAAWARENIDGVLPANLVRYNTSEPNIARYLPECDKIVYAVGFERRNNIVIGDYEHASYNPHVGIIGPGLFGLGIAYPELKPDPFGSVESQVGLWKFMAYLNKVMPAWFMYHT